MSTLAVFLVLGTGTAYAAGSIGSQQVIDDSLRSIDIKNDNLTGTDTKNGTLGAGELSDAARNQLLPSAHYSGGGSQIVDTDDTDGLQEVTSVQVPAGQLPGRLHRTGDQRLERSHQPALPHHHR